MKDIGRLVDSIPCGYSEALYCGDRWAVTKDIFNDGKSVKVFARSLAGSEYISFNYYETNQGNLLKPCKMPESRVVDFLVHMKVIQK